MTNEILNLAESYAWLAFVLAAVSVSSMFRRLVAARLVGVAYPRRAVVMPPLALAAWLLALAITLREGMQPGIEFVMLADAVLLSVAYPVDEPQWAELDSAAERF